MARELGVLALQAVARPDRPGVILLLEAYADAEAYAAHLRAPHFLAYKAAVEVMVLSLRLGDVDPILPRAQGGFGAPAAESDKAG